MQPAERSRESEPDQPAVVSLANLLGGGDAIRYDLDSVRRRIAGRVVMVTGAAGSIGSELCRQILEFAPRRLVCVDRAETPLFHLQNVLSGSLQEPNKNAPGEIVYRVADVTGSVRMARIIRDCAVKVIFHSAAYKHVPLMEENLEEALNNNVFGLASLMETADRCGCEDFLLISSDKAVNPTSFMGCT